METQDDSGSTKPEKPSWAETSAWVGLFPPRENALRLAVEGGSSPSYIHLTVLYLGKTERVLTGNKRAVMREHLRQLACDIAPILVRSGDYALFPGRDYQTLYVGVSDGGGLAKLRARAEGAALLAGIGWNNGFPFRPHFSVKRLRMDEPPPNLKREPEEFRLSELHFVVNGEHEVFRLTLF